MADLKILADENITCVDDYFGHLGEVEKFNGRALSSSQVVDADILLVRSVTQVNESLLRGSSVRFVGTCTIGMDHIDQSYLQKNGIGFAAAPGCNANAVVDYVLSAMTRLALDQGFSICDKRVGIVGVGNVGRRLKQRLEAYGVTCFCCDPPLQRQGKQGEFISLDELLEQAEIISLHTPLSDSGVDQTLHLLDGDRLQRLKPNAIIINSGRGPVIDNQALLKLLEERADISAVLDVWENEPDIDRHLLQKVAIATPHIAGYSLEGKLAGTEMVYQAVCKFFSIVEQQSMSALLPADKEIRPVDLPYENSEHRCYQLVQQCYDIASDDRGLRNLAKNRGATLAAGFDQMRKDYPVRREICRTQVASNFSDDQLKAQLSALGFKI